MFARDNIYIQIYIYKVMFEKETFQQLMSIFIVSDSYIVSD